MELSPGYKHSEVGVIPIDWSEVPLSHTAKRIKRGASPRPIDSPVWFDSSSSVGWVRISDVTRSGRYLMETTQQLSDEGIRRSRPVPSGSLIMSICATVGRPIETRIDTCIHDGFVVFDQPAIDQSYLYHVLSALEPTWSKHGQTGSQMNLNTALINGCLIPLPPTEDEQRAIATALSDVDALIVGLEKLIAKKRDLKQAAMQQLLSGQTRLPGFSGEWTHRSLGSLGVIYGGLVGKSKDDFGHGLASYVPFVNVMANIRIDCGALESVDVESTENQNRVLAGDLLFNGSSETPEEVALCALMTQTVENLYLNSFCFGFRFKEGAQTSGLFLAYLIRSQMGRDLMKALAQGSTRYNLSKTALLQATLALPSLEEQVAIATILSDMDADLVALEGRLAKTSELKQGMMQELLTGRTRLVSKSEI